jgi:hypothetical protein
MKRAATGHASHAKHLQLLAAAVDIGIGFVPVDLSFNTPVVALRNESLALQQSQLALAFTHVLANRRFGYQALRPLLSNPSPDSMRRVLLFPRRVAICCQN